MPKYFPIVWKLALNLSEACVLHRKAFIFTFPRLELHSSIQGRHDNENTFPFPIDQMILACGMGRSWLKFVNFMPDPEAQRKPAWSQCGSVPTRTECTVWWREMVWCGPCQVFSKTRPWPSLSRDNTRQLYQEAQLRSITKTLDTQYSNG